MENFLLCVFGAVCANLCSHYIIVRIEREKSIRNERS